MRPTRISFRLPPVPPAPPPLLPQILAIAAAAMLAIAAGLALTSSPAQGRALVPLKAYRYAPVLAAKQRALWPGAPAPYTLGGLVEQESCVSLKSRRCWDPRAELKTYREYGFGLGQITIAYRADHSVRFDRFKELKARYAALASWRWQNRFDAGKQLIAIVESVHRLWRHVPPAATSTDRWAFTLSSYNGGLGGIFTDRRYCANSRGCDPRRWYGNVETHSLKSRVRQRAYGGQSWYSINRGYVRNVLEIRRAKYRQFWN